MPGRSRSLAEASVAVGYRDDHRHDPGDGARENCGDHADGDSLRRARADGTAHEHAHERRPGHEDEGPEDVLALAGDGAREEPSYGGEEGDRAYARDPGVSGGVIGINH